MYKEHGSLMALFLGWSLNKSDHVFHANWLLSFYFSIERDLKGAWQGFGFSQHTQTLLSVHSSLYIIFSKNYILHSPWQYNVAVLSDTGCRVANLLSASEGHCLPQETMLSFFMFTFRCPAAVPRFLSRPRVRHITKAEMSIWNPCQDICRYTNDLLLPPARRSSHLWFLNKIILNIWYRHLPKSRRRKKKTALLLWTTWQLAGFWIDFKVLYVLVIGDNIITKLLAKIKFESSSP